MNIIRIIVWLHSRNKLYLTASRDIASFIVNTWWQCPTNLLFSSLCSFICQNFWNWSLTMFFNKRILTQSFHSFTVRTYSKWLRIIYHWIRVWICVWILHIFRSVIIIRVNSLNKGWMVSDRISSIWQLLRYIVILDHNWGWPGRTVELLKFSKLFHKAVIRFSNNSFGLHKLQGGF